MAYTDRDNNFIEEEMSPDFSVDDILADFYVDHALQHRRSTAADDEDGDVRVYVPGKKVNKKTAAADPMATFMAAFDTLNRQEEKSYEDMAADFAAQDYSRPAQKAEGSAAGSRSDSLYTAAPSVEEELREYLANLSDEELEQMSRESQVYKDRYKNPNRRSQEIEIDSRFKLGKDVFKSNDTMRYGDIELDTSAEPDYVPKAQKTVGPSHWAEGEGELPEEETKKSKKNKKKRGKRNKAAQEAEYENGYSPAEEEYSDSFRDREAADSEYARQEDYSGSYDEQEREKADFFPSSFREYIFSLITTVLFRMRSGKSSTSTMEEDEEELGPEMNADNAVKYYGSFTYSLRLRGRMCLAVLALMLYISFGLPVPGMLGHYAFASAALMCMQLTVMLLCLDVVTGALVNIARGRPGADTLAVISCIATTVDALLTTLGVVDAHLPLCAASALSAVGLLYSSLFSTRGLRKAIRVLSIAKTAYAVTGEMNVCKGEITLLKSLRPSKGFLRRLEESPPDETYFSKAFLPTLVLTVLLSLAIALVKKSFGAFSYIFSAVLVPAAPIAALLCFALPFFVGTFRIFQSGAAIAGWSGLCDIGRSKNLIVTDRDLFPESCVKMEQIRLFEDYDSLRIISYAGTMMSAAGSAVSACFADEMIKNGCTMRRVEGFEYLAGGGMKGYIDGDYVLCGNSDLMRLMSIRIPKEIVESNSILIAINNRCCGVFTIEYIAQPQVKNALMRLMRSNRHPIFAIRDFNITPQMLHDTFGLATDGYDFPPYVERFEISSAKPSEDSKVAAMVCREGLGPLTRMADTGRTMYMTVRVNLAVTAIVSVLGVLAVFLKLITVGFVTPGFVLGFMLLTALPVLFVSFFMR